MASGQGTTSLAMRFMKPSQETPHIAKSASMLSATEQSGRLFGSAPFPAEAGISGLVGGVLGMAAGLGLYILFVNSAHLISRYWRWSFLHTSARLTEPLQCLLMAGSVLP